MAIVLEDPNESRDRRLKMLLDTATSAMQIQNQKQQMQQQAQQNQAENLYRTQQLSQKAQEIALADPAKNKYLRAEMATQNRSRMADARYKEAYVSGELAPKMSPSRMNAKDKRTEELITTISENQTQRELIDDASVALTNLTKGLGGKIERGFSKRLAADNPLLGDYQKVKMVLTNAQLRESLMLKGAISDVENKWLAEAAANDDLLSTPRAEVVFSSILKKMDAMDDSKLSSYKRIYGEDPNEWDEIRGLKNKKALKSFSKDVNLPPELAQQLGGIKGIKAIREKKK